MTAYDELRARKGRTKQADTELRKARKDEQIRRYQEARRRAGVVLADRHREEYEALMVEERAAVDRRRGPLPGDDA